MILVGSHSATRCKGLYYNSTADNLDDVLQADSQRKAHADTVLNQAPHPLVATGNIHAHAGTEVW